MDYSFCFSVCEVSTHDDGSKEGNENQDYENPPLHVSLSGNAMNDVKCSRQDNDQTVSDSDSSSDIDHDISPQNIKAWALHNRISNVALSEILGLLKKKHPHLPKDARTLLRTRSDSTDKIRPMGNGSFAYFGLKAFLQEFIRDRAQTNESISLKFNIDGLPIHRSSNLSFWPVLCEIDSSAIFVVCLFIGPEKPPLQHFLEEFVTELKCLLSDGIQYGEHMNVALKLSCITADAPARAFIKGTKLCSGFYGCDKCTQKGTWLGRVVYMNVDDPLRTDLHFRSEIQEGHHNNQSPFLNISEIDMIDHFPLDGMHLVYLGVMRKLLNIFVKGQSRSVRLSSVDVDVISETIRQLGKQVPSEFCRRGRSLRQLDLWKATEYRLFLCYTGIICFKNVLREDLYQHFILLMVSIRILCDQRLYATEYDTAVTLLTKFITEGQRLFGSEFLVYNVHALVHLPNDVKIHGPLDNFSCFPFESFLGRLKRFVRSGNKPLSQICRRISEYGPSLGVSRFCDEEPSRMKRQYSDGPFVFGDERSSYFKSEFKVLVLRQGILKLRSCDSYFSDCRGKVYEAINFVVLNDGQELIIGRPFKLLENLFEHPIESRCLGIFVAKVIDKAAVFIPLSNVSHKYMCFLHKKKYILLPLLHLR